jgi:WD40 repeat protein
VLLSVILRDSTSVLIFIFDILINNHRVEAMAVNGHGNVLVCGHSDGRITLRAVWNLQQTHVVNHAAHGAIRCLWFTEDYQFLLIGSADGTISVGTDPDVRWKLLHAAIQKTPLLGPNL